MGYSTKQKVWDGTTNVALATTAATVTGGTPLTILAAGGGAVKYRFFRIQLGSTVAGAIVLSDGMGTYICPANSTITIDFGHLGLKQTTANTAITATLAGATLSADVLYSLDA